MSKKHAEHSEKHPHHNRYDTIHPQARLIQLPVMALVLTLIVEFFNRRMEIGRAHV